MVHPVYFYFSALSIAHGTHPLVASSITFSARERSRGAARHALPLVDPLGLRSSARRLARNARCFARLRARLTAPFLLAAGARLRRRAHIRGAIQLRSRSSASLGAGPPAQVPPPSAAARPS